MEGFTQESHHERPSQAQRGGTITSSFLEAAFPVTPVDTQGEAMLEVQGSGGDGVERRREGGPSAGEPSGDAWGRDSGGSTARDRDRSEEASAQSYNVLNTYGKLQLLWQDELAAAEVLPFPADVVSQASTAIQSRLRSIALLQEREKDAIAQKDGSLGKGPRAGASDGVDGDVDDPFFDPKKARNLRGAGSATGAIPFAASQLLVLEVERVKYMLMDLLRTRVKKIQRHAEWLASDWEGRVVPFLSPQEQDLLRGYNDIKRRALRDGGLAHLPEPLRVENVGPHSVQPFDVKSHCIVYVLEDVGRVDIGHDTTTDFHQGDVFMLRYDRVRSLLMEHRVRLIV